MRQGRKNGGGGREETREEKWKSQRENSGKVLDPSEIGNVLEMQGLEFHKEKYM